MIAITKRKHILACENIFNFCVQYQLYYKNVNVQVLKQYSYKIIFKIGQVHVLT